MAVATLLLNDNSPAPIRASKIPTFNGESPVITPAKRRTRVSDLLARLSSSTASSRAKAESKTDALGGMPPTTVPRSFVSVFRSRTSVIDSLQQQQSQLHQKTQPTSPSPRGSSLIPSVERRLSSQAVSSPKKPSHHGHKRIPSDISESSIFFPKMSSSPPPPKPPSRMVSRDRVTQDGFSRDKLDRVHDRSFHDRHARSSSQNNRLSDVKRYSTASSSGTSISTPTNRATSYTDTSASSGLTRASSLGGSVAGNTPPSAPLPPTQPKRTSAAAPVVIRPVSRQRIVKRPGSRVGQVGGINPALMRIQNSRVEELKTKINELEEVLQYEKAERDAAVSRVAQIKSLESLLAKERYEKEMLNMKLRNLMEQLMGSAASSPNLSGSDTATLADDERIKYFQERILELEARLENDSRLESESIGSTDTDEDEDRGLLDLQTEVSVLKSENKLLKRENNNYQNTLKRQNEEIKIFKNRLQKLEPEFISVSEKLKETGIKLKEHKERASNLETQLSSKELFIKERLSLLENIESKNKELDIKTRDLEEKLEKTREESDRFRIDRDDLQRQVQGFLTARKQTDKQITGLERDNRRAKRLITALETSLQDLKISLEEKAMENDELNRSILKVMEQANETIEGAKRHSLLITSPSLGSDHRLSMDARSSTANRSNLSSPDMTRNSVGSSRFSRTSDVMTSAVNNSVDE